MIGMTNGQTKIVNGGGISFRRGKRERRPAMAAPAITKSMAESIHARWCSYVQKTIGIVPTRESAGQSQSRCPRPMRLPRRDGTLSEPASTVEWKMRRPPFDEET